MVTAPKGTGPRIIYLPPLLNGGLAELAAAVADAASLGFTHVVLPAPFHATDPRLLDDPATPHGAIGFAGSAEELLLQIETICQKAGVAWMLDLRIDAVASGGKIATAQTELFHSPNSWAAINPLGPDPVASLRDGVDVDKLAAFWADLMRGWQKAGAAGFRLGGMAALGPQALRLLMERIHTGPAAPMMFGSLADVATGALSGWRAIGLDRVEFPIERWDEAAGELLDRATALADAAPLLAVLEQPFAPRFAARYASRAAWERAATRLIHIACAIGDGWMAPAGFVGGETLRMDPCHATPAGTKQSPPALVLSAIAQASAAVPALGPPTRLPAMAPGISGIRRATADGYRVTIASSTTGSVAFHPARLIGGYMPADDQAPTVLPAGEVRSFTLVQAPNIRLKRPDRRLSATAAANTGRVTIEAVAPAVDGGRFAAKRVVGDTVIVECDIVCEGHDQLAAVVEWRQGDAAGWQTARMRPMGNDRWRAEFDLTAVGRWLFRVCAWRDRFATFRDELTKKNRAGLDVALEATEGQLLVAEAAECNETVAAILSRLAAAKLVAERVKILLSDELAIAMRAADPRPFLTETVDFPIDADRVQAANAAWYEIFPRSMSGDGVRHGTFRDVIAQLPRIRAMGFDVLYFPPIHPIGRINRKGRNNTLTPAADDPGSPYAIGSKDGGHDALHPELGSFDDFEAMRSAAHEAGLEIAIDFAIQCAPDHPWLTQHKGWFDWRPDGSLRYAENPPKKYEDIVNVDFYAPDAVPDLWVALGDVVFFWLDRGVRIFRVDNPHTKPFPFWEWLILEVRSAYPDAIFLAEAFTRPKVMGLLGKVGFHQSYTYFTWRNTKAELQAYLTELSTGNARDFFRPNFFVNTPDINPVFLQTSGRAGFLVRAALAATLSGTWGVYCGFELCEGAPVPGKEEYLDSEKYQLRAWDWDRPGNIVPEVTRLNQIRRLHPALWTHTGVNFLPSDDDQVIFFEKATPDRSDVLLVAICLDPYNAHSAAIELPLWRWGLTDQASIDCRDVVHDTRFTLSGKWQRVALSPEAPYTIWHAHPQGPYSA